jgi:aspartyl-tRNA(Asn)/glutamyl-tRNA(Gln) amidotransferase subunit B
MMTMLLYHHIMICRVGDPELGQRVEIKNLAKLRAIVKAIEYEIRRQIAAKERGEIIERETRGFDADQGITVKMRSKEDMLDYRFFPEPDLPPLTITDQWIQHVKKSMPELPEDVRTRFQASYGLSPAEVAVLQTDPHAIAFFEAVVAGRYPHVSLDNFFADLCHIPTTGGKRNAKKVFNWMSTDLFGRLRAAKLASSANNGDPLEMDDEEESLVSTGTMGGDLGLQESPVTAQRLGQLVDLVEGGVISGKVGKELLTVMMTDERDPMIIVEEKNWAQISDPTLLVIFFTNLF